MDISLDEYISRHKSEGNWKGVQSKSERKFKAERREEGSEDDNDDTNLETNDVGKFSSSGINYIDLDMPDDDEIDLMFANNHQENNKATVKNPGFDLRNKIFGFGETVQGDVPKANSQQWRITRPNVMNQRPAGMPPLIPQSLVEERRLQNNPRSKAWGNRNNNRTNFYDKNGRKTANNNGNFRNGVFNGYNNGKNNNGASNNGFNINNGYNYNRYNNNNGCNANNSYNKNNAYDNNGSNNNGFCNNNPYNNNIRNNNPYNNNIRNNNNHNNNNHNINNHINNKCTNGYMKGGNNVVTNGNAQSLNQRSNDFVRSEVNDLTIECPAESIELLPTHSVAAKSLMIAPGRESIHRSEDNTYRPINSLRTLLSINNPQQQASKALELLQSLVEQPKHKPLYDLKIQKEIHAIQKKPLLYKCPGGDVVSSDGNGINCEIIPRTSGVSLNHRFA